MSSDEADRFEDALEEGESGDEMDVDDEEVPEFDSDEEADLEQDVLAMARNKVKEKKTFAYDEMGLKTKLAEIQLKINGADPEWIETVSITSAASPDIPDPQDDLKRESEFYAATLANVNVALDRLKSLGVPAERPLDYYAEMLKNDEHMLKLKDSLLAETRRLSEKQERVKQKLAKKYAKQVQIETKQKREKARKEDLEAIKQWRKTAKDGVDDGSDEEFPDALLDSSSTLRKEIRDRQTQQKRQVNKKRAYKDSKWGFGGSKRAKKDNDRSSASDISQWNTARNKSLPPGFAKGLKKAKRPGKKARQQTRK